MASSPVSSPRPGPEKIHYEDRRRTPQQPSYGAGNRMMRQGASNSYDPQTGRSMSSVDEEDSRSHVTNNNHASGDGRQIPSGFAARDARCTQMKTPVSRRPLTMVHD
jgi:hypothetical protein